MLGELMVSVLTQFNIHRHLTQLEFFTLPSCSLTAEMGWAPKSESESLVQILSITFFRMLQTSIMSSTVPYSKILVRMLLSQGLSTCFVHSQNSTCTNSCFICTSTTALSHIHSPNYVSVY